jgi:hypothetical protein
MSTTSVSGLTCFTARRSSRPVVPGIMRSVSTTCTLVLPQDLERLLGAVERREDAHVLALEDLLERGSTLERSSSTTRIVAPSPGGGPFVAGGVGS